MGVKSIKVRGPDVKRLLDEAVSVLTEEIGKVKTVVDEIKADVKTIKEK